MTHTVARSRAVSFVLLRGRVLVSSLTWRMTMRLGQYGCALVNLGRFSEFGGRSKEEQHCFTRLNIGRA